jgi:hypothetical protein
VERTEPKVYGFYQNVFEFSEVLSLMVDSESLAKKTRFWLILLNHSDETDSLSWASKLSKVVSALFQNKIS